MTDLTAVEERPPRRPTVPLGPRQTPARARTDALTAVRDAKVLAKLIELGKMGHDAAVASYNAAFRTGGEDGVAELRNDRNFVNLLATTGRILGEAASYGHQKLARLDYVGDAPAPVSVENTIEFVLKMGDGPGAPAAFAARAQQRVAPTGGNGAGDDSGDHFEPHQG